MLLVVLRPKERNGEIDGDTYLFGLTGTHVASSVAEAIIVCRIPFGCVTVALDGLAGLAYTNHHATIPDRNARAGGVAQSVRALACHARGRGFESRHSRHFC
jgi:hypothetical protein